MVFHRIKAWLELIKLGQSGMSLIKEEKAYMRGNIIRELKKEGGFFYKKDLKQWALEAGAKKVETATPITVFKITK